MLTMEHLSKTYTSGLFRKKSFQAVEDISFQMESGKTLGIVGESGSGKSTLAQCLLRLMEPTKGKIVFDNRELTALKQKELARIRPQIQMIFQDPDSALDPSMTIKQSLKEALRLRRDRPIETKEEGRKKIEELLHIVGLANEHLDRYPHELSGGQNQRVVIARALSFEPSVIVADEPTASLDVSVQAQILQLLKKVQQERGMTMLLISHDLDIIRHMCERVMVLYKGNVVESGVTQAVLSHPEHPYTRMLLNSKDEKYRNLPDEGEHEKYGCVFYNRCVEKDHVCQGCTPALIPLEAGHTVSCIKCGSLKIGAVGA